MSATLFELRRDADGIITEPTLSWTKLEETSRPYLWYARMAWSLAVIQFRDQKNKRKPRVFVPGICFLTDHDLNKVELELRFSPAIEFKANWFPVKVEKLWYAHYSSDEPSFETRVLLAEIATRNLILGPEYRNIVSDMIIPVKVSTP